jgi:hypothetical protein
MTDTSDQQKAVAMYGVFGVGALLVVIAVFVDPVGPSPDSGVFDLGPIGTKWLLGVLGGSMVLGGSWLYVREKFFGSE